VRKEEAYITLFLLRGGSRGGKTVKSLSIEKGGEGKSLTLKKMSNKKKGTNYSFYLTSMRERVKRDTLHQMRRWEVRLLVA